MNPNEQRREVVRCLRRPAYFISTYCKIYDAVLGDWIDFLLWPAQEETLLAMETFPLVVVLKARQLGLTWLMLSYILWKMIFRPSATALLFSRRDDEAVHLLTDRLKEMYKRLPDWLRFGLKVIEDSAHEWQLINGSVARAFPTTAGDTYSATIALVDEADLVPDLNFLMNAVKPTIDAGGQMILLSRSDKSDPQSEFKNVYRAACQGINGWHPVFIPWYARPDRDQEWYERQKIDIYSRTGALDDLHQQYPATDMEALAPAELDKRIAPIWIENCFVRKAPIRIDGETPSPSIPGLRIYIEPTEHMSFIIGADPAEGNPTSDDSALTVLDSDSGEEAAKLSGKLQPAIMAAHIDKIGKYFNNAPVLVERNNHGHAVILWLADNSKLQLLHGIDDRDGWLTTSRSKTAMYDIAADAFREKTTTLHSFDTYTQLVSIEGASLNAPEGLHDDMAVCYALALTAIGTPHKERGLRIVGKGNQLYANNRRKADDRGRNGRNSYNRRNGRRSRRKSLGSLYVERR